MVALRQDITREGAPRPHISAESMAFLNYLRLVAMRCRAKRKAHLFEACALLQTTPQASREAYADTLMRCLNDALHRPARLYRPGTSELTFDEKWLAQLGLACARGDEASLRFLLGSRLSRENRRLIGFLVGRIAEHFSLN